MSTIVVTPPAIAARVAEAKPSQWVRPGSLTCTWLSTSPGSPAWLPPVTPRAYASTVHLGTHDAAVLTGDDAVRLPLPGGWVATAWGTELHKVIRAAASLAPAAPVRVPA